MVIRKAALFARTTNKKIYSMRYPMTGETSRDSGCGVDLAMCV